MTAPLPMDLLASGNHVAARAAADQLLGDKSAKKADRADATDALAASDLDPWALRTFALTAALLLVLSWLAMVSHPSVAAARHLVDAIAHSDEAAAKAFFTESGWTDSGQALFSELQGRHGRAFARSKRAEEVGFVLVNFRDPRARRYLMFDADTWKIRSVVQKRPPRPRPTPAGQ